MQYKRADIPQNQLQLIIKINNHVNGKLLYYEFEEESKKKLLEVISEIIKIKNWKQAEAAKHLNVDQPKISQMKRGRCGGFSLERILNFLIKLGCKIELSIYHDN